MPILAATTKALGQGGGTDADDQGGTSASFFEATYEYSEPITSLSAALGASQVNFQPTNITPGGYLRGVLLTVTGSGGVIGTGVTTADWPWNLFQNLELLSVDGTDLLYPMGGYSYYLVTRFTRPWDGDPALDPFYSDSVNPAFRFRFFVESRMSLGVVPNTDARAQYRFNVSYNASTVCFSTAPTTLPTINTDIALETYQQPDPQAYPGASLLPPGMAMQREVSHQSGINLSGGDQTLQSNRVGNQIRSLILVTRASGGARTDISGDPIRWRLDNASLLVEKRSRRDYEDDRFFGGLGLEQLPTRPTGVYVYPRWHNPGKMEGGAWLPTKTASYLAWEINDSANALAAGSLEIITEDLAPAGSIPAYLRDI